jgi:hypothetical protein
MTEASQLALVNLRELSTLQWYVIPLLALTFYIYTAEMKKARQTGDWNGIFAGLTVFGMDFINETWNGWFFHLSGVSGCWTTPGPTALRTMIGWNIEIMFMFAILGIIYYNSLSAKKEDKVLGIPNRWFWALWYTVFCVFIEVALNLGGHLVWEWRFWNRSLEGIALIFLFGYFHFFVAALLVIGMKSTRNKIITIAVIYSIAILGNVIAFAVMGWNY